MSSTVIRPNSPGASSMGASRIGTACEPVKQWMPILPAGTEKVTSPDAFVWLPRPLAPPSSLQEQCAPLSQMLFGWAHLRLGAFPMLHVSAEDVVQETWMRALAALDQRADLEEPRALKAWLFGIARNVLLEELRRPRSSGSRRTERSTAMPSDVLDTVTSICTQLSRGELVQLFLAFAAELEEVDRQLLVHCGFEGAHPEEVALRFALEPSSTARRWHRLRERLRESRWDERMGLRDEAERTAAPSTLGRSRSDGPTGSATGAR